VRGDSEAPPAVQAAACVRGFHAEAWSCQEGAHCSFARAAFTQVSYTYFALSLTRSAIAPGAISPSP
jgi:hypothetical protein